MTKVRLTLALALASIMAFSAIAWLTVLSPRLSKADEISTRAADLELANLTLLRRQRDLLDQARSLPETAQQASDLFAAVPQTADLPVVLDQITQAAATAGIPDSGVTAVNASTPMPVTEAANGTETQVDLADLRLDVAVEGSADQVLTFLREVQSLERAFLVESISLAAGSVPGSDTNIEADPNDRGASDQAVTVTGRLFVLQSPLPNLVRNAEAIVAEALEKDSQ